MSPGAPPSTRPKRMVAGRGRDRFSGHLISSHLADSDAGDDQDQGDEETSPHGAVGQLMVTFAGAADEGVEDTQGGQSEDRM